MKEKYIEKEIEGLPVILIEGKIKDKSILCFHGFGATGHDLLPLNELFPTLTWIFPEGPINVPLLPGFKGRAWFPIDFGVIEAQQKSSTHNIEKAFPDDLASIREKIKKLVAALNIQPEKLILAGFSQGAMLALDYAIHSPKQVAGLLLFSSTLIHEKSLKQLLPNHRGLPFFQSHGIDDPLLPFERAKRLEKVLIEGGLKGQLHTFSGGHEIHASLVPQIKEFLASLV